MISPNSIHGGGISTPRCGASSRLSLALDAVFALEDLLIVTDLLMVLDATLFAAFALFAALFFSPAALLVAARVRGSAHPGLSPVVLPPLLGSPGRQQPLPWLLPRLLSVTWDDAGRDAPRLPPVGLFAGRDEFCCV